MQRLMRAPWLLLLTCLYQLCRAATTDRTFSVENNVFMKDDKPLQIISGSLHYHRIPRQYWQDRLERIKALGLNAIQSYVPWNFHERQPGQYSWEAEADLEAWLAAAHSAGLLVLLRPGPYVCAEWDRGGLPWWLEQVPGASGMVLRSSDARYLAAVDKWWHVLLPRLKKHLYANGGPIVMVQIENEYGSYGSDKVYLRHLLSTAKQHLGNDVIYYTTDGASQQMVTAGSLPGDELLTVVDFPVGTNLEAAFALQASFNPPGKSPPMCSEFYTGWLTHWGESMANTSTTALASALKDLLAYANGTASVNLYMAHGGTNFEYWAGANLDGSTYQPHITSYDYDAPVSEAGDYGQPGIGGESKFEAIRQVISAHSGVVLPKPPPPPAVHAYGVVAMTEHAVLMDALPALASPRAAHRPGSMEQYGQRGGLIMYRTNISLTQVPAVGATLDLGAPVHDAAQVLLDGRLVGRLERNQAHHRMSLLAAPEGVARADAPAALELAILVDAQGRQNFGCCLIDPKGLTSPNVTLDGEPLVGWEVLPLPLDDLSRMHWSSAPAAAAIQRLPKSGKCNADGAGSSAAAADIGPVFYRGQLDVAANADGGGLADTYLATHGWGKGLAWVNGFNLGWYWPARGPQMSLYVPGTLLRAGTNEVILLELAATAPAPPAVHFEAAPDFSGPPQRQGFGQAS